MIDVVLAWAREGAVERLLLLGSGLLVALGLLLGRWPRADAIVSGMGAAALAGLGGYAAWQRLVAVPWRLGGVPERQLVGAVAGYESSAFSALGGSLVLAALVGAGWSWRRSRASDGAIPIAPTLVAALSALSAHAAARQAGLPTPGDLFGLLAAAGALLTLVSALRPDARWLGPALASLLGTAALVHGAWMRGLVLDPDVGSGLVGWLVVRDLSAGMAAMGVVVCLLGARGMRASVPVVGVLLAVVPALTQLPAQWARHPASSPWGPALPFPGGEPTRLAGGCLVGPDGTEVDHGLHSPRHGLVGCSEPGAVRTVAAPPELPLAELVRHDAGGADLGLLTGLAPDGAPDRLAPWFAVRWDLPVWRMVGSSPEPRPVQGSVLVTLGPPLRVIGVGGEVGLAEVLSRPGRRELLVVPDQATTAELVRFCQEAMGLRPIGSRCGLALGDVSAWEAWVQRPAPAAEGW